MITTCHITAKTDLSRAACMPGSKTAHALRFAEVQPCGCMLKPKVQSCIAWLNLMVQSSVSEANAGHTVKANPSIANASLKGVCGEVENLHMKSCHCPQHPDDTLMSQHNIRMTPADALTTITLPSEGRASAMAKLDVPVNIPTSKIVLAPVSLTRDFRNDPSNEPAQHSFF